MRCESESLADGGPYIRSAWDGMVMSTRKKQMQTSRIKITGMSLRMGNFIIMKNLVVE